MSNVSREMERLRNNQEEMPEIKITETKTQSAFHGLIGRQNVVEQRASRQSNKNFSNHQESKKIYIYINNRRKVLQIMYSISGFYLVESLTPALKKSMCDFSGLSVGDFKGITGQAAWGKGDLLTLDLVCSSCSAVSEESCRPRLEPLWLVRFMFFAFLAPVPFFLGHFI